MLVVNRVLPADMLGKADWEKAAFWTVWALSFLHAYIRSAPVALGLFNPAWREQCWGVVVLSISAVLLNWATTGDHLLKTIFTDTYWPVAGVDLSLLACAVVSGWAALKLAQRERGASVLPEKTSKQADSNAGEVAHA
jgi:hypothetical protein